MLKEKSQEVAADKLSKIGWRKSLNAVQEGYRGTLVPERPRMTAIGEGTGQKGMEVGTQRTPGLSTENFQEKE